MRYDQCKYAIFLCGNAGVGKSTLSNVLGAKFDAGFAFGEGLTKDVGYCEIEINGEKVLMIDAPGMYEASKENTQQNAKEIQKALGIQIPYKIAFVVASNAGRWMAQDVAIIDKVAEAIKASESGEKIEYVLIINQIHKEHWQYYIDHDTLNKMVTKLVAATKTKPVFATTLCCPFITAPSENAMLRDKLFGAFKMKFPYMIQIVKNIKADPDDLEFYEKALIVIFSPIWLPIGLVCMAFSSVKNKILYDDWEPFI